MHCSSYTSSEVDTVRNEPTELRQKVDRAEKAKRRLSFKLDQPAIPLAQGSMKTPAGKDKEYAEDEITKTVPRSQAAASLAEQGDSKPLSGDDEGSEEDEFDLTELSKPASIEDAIRTIQPKALPQDSVIPDRDMVLALIDLSELVKEWRLVGENQCISIEQAYEWMMEQKGDRNKKTTKPTSEPC